MMLKEQLQIRYVGDVKETRTSCLYGEDDIAGYNVKRLILSSTVCLSYFLIEVRGTD